MFGIDKDVIEGWFNRLKKDAIDPLQVAVNGLRTEFAQMRALPPGDVAWDQVVVMSAVAGERKTVRVAQDLGRVAVKLHVQTAPTGALLGINGETGLSVTGDAAGRQGDEFSGGRIGVVVLDNRAGATTFTVWAFLAVAKASGPAA